MSHIYDPNGGPGEEDVLGDLTELPLPKGGESISLERSAEIYSEHTGLDFDTGEAPLIERPERVKAPWQVLVIILPNSKHNHIVGRVEIFQAGGEEVYDNKGTKSPLGGNVKLFWCPHCKLPIPTEWHTPLHAVCRHCGMMTEPKDLIGEVILSHSPKAASGLIRRIHFGLQFADIYFMRFLSLPRMQEKTMTEKQSREMDQALMERSCVLYPFHKLAGAIHAKNPVSESTASPNFDLALENEVRRYL